MSKVDLPIALRPAVDFAATRESIFDDPGDEKSWHRSQRSESLSRYYDGREPSWYSSAIRPLAGADRVLDLGCGPGLALRALLDGGADQVLGIDRWSAFANGAQQPTPIVAHDLTLPMPFLESGSFDGVLSHYALDYVSPIGMRQVLREAHRVLTPGGRLLLYVAAVGLGSGDETRTTPYTPEALQTLLAEARFGEVDAQVSPNGRNTVVKARRSDAHQPPTAPQEARALIDRDTQLSMAFRGNNTRIDCELVGSGRELTVPFHLPPPTDEPDGDRVALCARVLAPKRGENELQLWAWRGTTHVAFRRHALPLAPTELRLRGVGAIDHLACWSPRELSIEPAGTAYLPTSDLTTGGSLSESERGAEGRRIAIEPDRADLTDATAVLGPGRNRFLIGRATNHGVAELDTEWLAGRLHGAVLDAADLGGNGAESVLQWAATRQALLFVEAPDWDLLVEAVTQRAMHTEMPIVLVDPALSGQTTPPAAPPSEAIALAHAQPNVLLVLASASRRLTVPRDLALLQRHLLHGGPTVGEESIPSAAQETLRHLTERTLLEALRQRYGRSWAEVGRRPTGDERV